MASHQRRRSSIDRASINSILATGEPGQPAAPPSPHVGNSPNRAYFAMSPPPRPITRHARALSYNPRRPNRLSLSFPVAPSTNSGESARPTPTSSTGLSFPPTPAEVVPTPSPNDPSGFLVALASQERKVLELKEELERAENELKHLKKQWAVHEGHKKKAEIRHVEPLQSLSMVVTESESGEPTVSTRHSAELDRRKALLSNLNIPKESRRKFSGAHTRTLSLLSPERASFKEPRPFPPVHESSFEHYGLTKSSTMPDTSQGITRVTSSRASNRHSYQSGMTLGVKQIGEDLKAGMWTFLEDLRQATVGDEAVNGTSNRSTLDTQQLGTTRRSSRGSLLNNGKRGQSPRASSPRTWDSLTGNNSLLDAAGSMWSEIAPLTPAPRTITANKKTSRPISLAAPAIEDFDDDWSNWDSPTPKSPRWSASTTLSDQNPATPSSSNAEDQTVKYATQSTLPPFHTSDSSRIMPDEADTPKRDEIQWPTLDKLSPGAIKGNLQRTMSTIMKEWEKSITPPERDEDLLAKAKKAETEPASSHDELAMMSR
jgi:hypothetical protein